jgi:hypothetical protein
MGNSMSSIVISGDSSGAITLAAPSVAGTNTITLPASTGTVLTTGSPQSGGVIQTVMTSFTWAGDSTSSTSFVTTSMTASITPKFSTSKILITVSAQGRTTSSNSASFYSIYRNNSTNLGGSDGLQIVNESSGALWCAVPITYLDSPATTSSTTYTIYLKATSGTAYLGWGTTMPAQLIFQEIAA